MGGHEDDVALFVPGDLTWDVSTWNGIRATPVRLNNFDVLVAKATEEHDLLQYQMYDTINFVSRKGCGDVIFVRTSGSDNVLLACPCCGMGMRFFESFPAQNGLPEVDVFACDACENMILHDRIRSFTAPSVKPPVS
jgi:hypothetical protein